MPPAKERVRIAALSDLHFSRTTPAGSLQPLFAQISESADILVLCGDLTDYGLVEEARLLARELQTLKIPAVSVLGNHDFESGQQADIIKTLAEAGVTVLDGDTADIHGIGFAGVKGFAGGFGRRALGPWGEDIIKSFVHEAVNEALKLETALARLRNDRIVAILHYSPIQETVEGEPPEIYRVPRLQPARGAAAPVPGERRCSTDTRITAGRKDARGPARRFTTCRGRRCAKSNPSARSGSSRFPSSLRRTHRFLEAPHPGPAPVARRA